jgi:hypothetical protein
VASKKYNLEKRNPLDPRRVGGSILRIVRPAWAVSARSSQLVLEMRSSPSFNLASWVVLAR